MGRHVYQKLFLNESRGEKCDLWPNAPSDPDEISAISSSALQIIIIYFSLSC